MLYLFITSILNQVFYVRFELLSSKFEGKVSLIHGQMSSIEKETVMKEFANSDSQKQILVSTSIIEV